jgi:hypothetical protein
MGPAASVPYFKTQIQNIKSLIQKLILPFGDTSENRTRPFKIDIAHDILDYLKRLLNNSRWLAK